MRSLSLSQVRALRLVRLGLAPEAPGSPKLNTPHDVVQHHLAMQGQDFPAVQWAIASRLLHHQPRLEDVLAAFDAGQLIRTWPMRGTLHTLTANDSRWLLDLCGHVPLRGAVRRLQEMGIDQAFIDTVRTVVKEQLIGGRQASRDELIEAFVAAGLDFTESQRRYHAIWYSCQIGDTLLGPTRQGEQLVVLTDDHVFDAMRLDTDASLDLLGRRFLEARGPASIEDLQHWTKLTKTQTRRAFSALGAELVPVQVHGHKPATVGGELFALAEQQEYVDDLRFGENVPRALLLGAFDEHLLGYRDRSLVLDSDKAICVDPGRNGMFRNTVVLDGRVVGTWRRRLLKSTARFWEEEC